MGYSAAHVNCCRYSGASACSAGQNVPWYTVGHKKRCNFRVFWRILTLLEPVETGMITLQCTPCLKKNCANLFFAPSLPIMNRFQ